MLGILKSRAAPVSRVGAYGKVPSAGDFLQTGPTDGVVGQFRDWLSDGIALAAERGSAWKDAFTSGTPQACVLAPVQGHEILIGVLQPSVDAVGRLFPLSIYRTLPRATVAAMPWLLPIVVTSWLQPIVEHLERCDGAPTDLTSIPGLTGPIADLPWQEAEQAYEGWKRQSEASAVFEAMLQDRTRIQPALDLLYAVAMDWRGQLNPTASFSLRAPVMELGIFGACCWAELVCRAARWRGTIPTLFWSTELDLHAGFPHPRALSELWLPASGEESMCRLGEAAGSATGTVPASVARLSTLAGATLGDFFDDVASDAARAN